MSHTTTRVLRADSIRIPAGSIWQFLPLVFLAVGIGGSAGSLVLAGGLTKELSFSWLTSFLFFLSVALGNLFFVLTVFATKAGWAVAVRRIAENLMAPLPIFAILFLPIWFGSHDLFHWTHAEAVEQDPLLQAKAPYLNLGFFTIRAVLYFLVWTMLSRWFSTQSESQDATGDHRTTRRLQMASGPAIILFSVSITFAGIDWIMSLDPHWYSTMWGVYFFAGSLVGAFAMLIIVLLGLLWSGFLRDVVSEEHFHDLGKLLFAFTVFWAYIGFSQYFLIWYGNIPEETVWYAHRMEGGWGDLLLLLAVGHFGVPFLFLMPRTIKRKTPLLFVGALWMLVMHYLDLYISVMPTLHHHGPRFGLIDVATLAAVGGFFFWGFASRARSRALIPVRDPRLAESLTYENA